MSRVATRGPTAGVPRSECSHDVVKSRGTLLNDLQNVHRELDECLELSAAIRDQLVRPGPEPGVKSPGECESETLYAVVERVVLRARKLSHQLQQIRDAIQ